MSRCRATILALLFFLTCTIKGRSNDTLYLEKYLELVIANHPLIQKANINDEISAAYLLKGKGALDPKVYSDYNRKRFDDKDYFTVWQSEIKIPTTLPIDLSVGYERNEGSFLNNENLVPSNGLVYGTLNLSLLRGLLFDEQRYNIQSAEIKGLKSQIEKEILTREVIYQAIVSYIGWVARSNTLDVNENFLELIRERHQNIVELFVNGDSPAIDTIESRLNIISAEKRLLESRSRLVKSVQSLSLFIWDGGGQPLQINSNIQSMRLVGLVEYLRKLSIMVNPNFISDPLIAKIDNEIKSLELDTKLEKENLKPQLDLKYNTILNLGKAAFDPTFTFNDYKYGVAFKYPIINRKSKGQLRLNQALSSQNEMDRVQYLGQLNNKFIALISQEEIQEDLLFVNIEKLTNSQLLFEAENLKFELGESSVFLLNKRELKLLEAQTDLIKSYTSLGKVFSELYYLKMGQN